MCKHILEWIVSGLIALLLGSFVVLVYKYCGTHIANETGATDYKWLPNQYMANAAEGINYMFMDSNGFNNLSSETSKIEILLMGGSHMEAIQIPTEQNTASRLNNLLPDCYTYNIGMSAHQFINCLGNVKAALQEYKPKKYVIIHTSDLSITLDEINAVANGTLQEIPSYDSGILYYLQMIPSIKVIYQQCLEKVKKDFTHNKTVMASATKAEDSGKFLMLSSVLAENERLCEDYGCRMIVAYTPEIEINEAGEMVRYDNKEWVKCVKESCENNGIIFLDCFDAFLSEYDEYNIVPFGFNNSKMGKWHLNADGHRILTSVIANCIIGEQQ